jgi:hypothetical protein
LKTRLLLCLAGTLGVAALVCGGFLLLRPALEDAARRRLVAEARRLGLSTTLRGARLSSSLSLELSDLVLENGRRARVSVRRVVISPRRTLSGLLGRAARVAVSSVAVELPAGLRLELAPSSWLVDSRAGAIRVALERPGERLELEATRGRDAGVAQLTAEGANLSSLLRLLWHGCSTVDLGTVDGQLQIESGPADELGLSLDGRASALAVASWASAEAGACANAPFGTATDAALQARLLVQPSRGRLRSDWFRVVAGGVEASGRVDVFGGLADPHVALEVEVPRLDFARLLATTGLELPAADLGSAALFLQVSGQPLDPSTLVVRQRLEFRPPARPLPAIERLRGPFVQEVVTASGERIAIRVSADSPDFIPLGEVPPLFLRTLLIAEDANFYGHPGVDLAELPVAMATNLVRGGFVRGGSTLSQQLAKNLFLSRRKTLSRKLEEVPLALLLDAALGKARVLEIYLNVIEWGPGLYGLRPAARHYFGVEPGRLTPKQMVFLASLIPGPVKYQRSFAGGVPTPFFDGLMTTLLTKLASVGAIDETECAAAIAEPLALTATAGREPAAP